jgi:hypothetical protein
LLQSQASNASFTELASQIRHPVPKVELKMQSAANKILEYASGSFSSGNHLSGEEIRRGKAEAKKLAPPFCSKPAGSLLKPPSKKSEPKKLSVLSTQPSLDQLVNRGLCDVTGERDHSAASGGSSKQGEKGKRASTSQSKKRTAPPKEKTEDFKIPKNKKQCV